MTLIAFEGPSSVGKSTLLKLVAERTGIPSITRDPVVRKFRVEQGHHDIFVLEQMSILNKIPWNKITCMIDRMPVVSQWVYDSVDERRGEVPYGDMGLIPQHSAFVYLIRDWPDQYHTAQQTVYDHWMKQIEAVDPVLYLHTDQLTVYECVQKIVAWIRGNGL